MRAQRASAAFLLALMLGALATPTLVRAQSAIALEQVAAGLVSPVAIAHASDGSGRLFITLQPGRIVIYDGVQLVPAPFLDISPLVSCCGERGLFSVAFHPEYATNGHFFVNYTNTAGDTVIARYTVSADPDIADPGSAVVFLAIDQPFDNHNGGQLQFGPDGYLYIGMGDGGSGGDPGNRAQNPATLLGKMLRIDVNSGPPYSIPPSNPFAGTPGFLDEIWALGLRNPWRFSFDRLTGDLFIADVGQGNREEVNLQPATSPGGENYGWRLMEGTACFNPPSGCNNGSLTLPILEYDHALGCSITGGYRYRGMDYPELYGAYFYGDYCSGRIWRATENGGRWTTAVAFDSSFAISSFGEDERGELYLAHHAGAIYRVVGAPRVVITAVDATATEAGPTTGAFRVTRTGSTAAPLTVFYTVGGTATPGTDYAALPGSLTLPAGVATADILVTPINDSLMEGNETVLLTLRPTAPYTIGSPNSATVTLVSDERVSISAIRPTATEAGPTTGAFRVTRTGSTAAPLTVFYMVGGTATPGTDYAALPGSLTLPAGVATADILVIPMNDTLVESNETVVATLAPRSNYTIGTPSSATVTIVSND